MGCTNVRVVALLLPVLVCMQSVSGRQEFLQQPQYTEVNPGQTAKLECSILNKHGTCGWQKDRKPQGLFPGKYEWSGDQAKGDCSLRIINSSIDFDDGVWECQVTASSPTDQDELSSTPVRLVVRNPPQLPTLGALSMAVLDDGNITVTAEQNTTITCSSDDGNPPATLQWFLGDLEITHFSTQVNSSDVDKPKLWKVIGHLQYSFNKVDNGQQLKCLVNHKAYPQNVQQVVGNLNVQYVPTVTLEGEPKGDIEDDKDVVQLNCHVDANPSAVTTWLKNGQELTSTETLKFNPIRKEDSGVYTCKAQNPLGSSKVATVHLDVKYKPQNVRISPDNLSVYVHNHTVLSCTADSNPRSHFLWLFKPMENSSKAQVIGTDSTLHLSNISYSVQGLYVCLASNTIHGEEQSTASTEIQLNVIGVPQIITNVGHHGNKVLVETGEDAILDVPFCSDPPPTIITWEWGSGKLAVGEGKGKFIAEQLPSETKQTDCYEARLVIQKAEVSDARRYTLMVRNGKGNDSYVMALDVSEPVSMSAVIGIVIGCLIILVIAILIVLYAFRSEKWCFHKGGSFKPSNHHSEEASPSITSSLERSPHPRAIPPDALYTLPSKVPKNDQERLGISLDTVDTNNDKTRIEGILKSESRLPTFSSNGYHSDGLESHYRPQIHEVADI